MRTIIAGSRTITDREWVFNTLSDMQPYLNILSVLSGCANGPDRFGEQWAYSLNIDIEKFPANWDLYGKRAGFVRNIEMAEKADALVAFWDGSSKGTRHMIGKALDHGLTVMVFRSHSI